MDPTTAVFRRLPEPKRQAVLTAAAAQFARDGFAATKVDEIAARAGISVGSLYQYFGTKENAFLAVLEDGMAELQNRLGEIVSSPLDPWERIEAVVRLIPGHSRQHAAVLRLYHEIAGEGLSDLGTDFCRRFEGLSAEVYRTLLAQAKAGGLVRADVDERYAAFFLDNLFMALQFSFSCDYHQLRKTVYLGPDREADEEQLIVRVLDFFRYGLAVRS